MRSAIWKSKRAIALVLVILAAIAIGVGAGVGVTVHRDRTTMDSLNQVDTIDGSTSTSSLATATTTSTMATSFPTTLKHGVMRNSSFAAVITVGGVKHVFFQDTNGTIRQTTRDSSSSNTWFSPVDMIVASNARSNTPMSAILRKHNGFIVGGQNLVCAKDSCILQHGSLRPELTIAT